MQNLQPDSSLEQGQLHQLHTQGMAVQYRLLWSEQVAVAAALRHDHNERFADADTAQLQASWHVTKALRLRAAAGSGIKNPTTTELFGYDPLTFVGNPSLRPEYSRGWEVALEHSALQGRVLTGIGWSQSRLRDEIYTVYSPSFVASPANRSSLSRQRMLELYGQARLDGGWSVDASYGHLSARENNIAEVRRPPQVGSVSVAWQGAATGLHATLRYNGSTDDYNFTDNGPPIVRLGGYSLLQLGGQWRITPRWEVFGRLENALGAQYEDVYTYRMPGRAAYIGIRSAL
jgi:vitamin B12 transporter